MEGLVNLTPHELTFLGRNREVIGKLRSSGVARCIIDRRKVDKAGAIPINKTSFRNVTGLPPEKEGVLYIVSSPVAQAVKDYRDDIVIPDQPIRSDSGAILGCRSLARIS